MVRGEVTIKNKLGLHARPAASIVKETGKYKSAVMLERDGMRANAKSIMDILIVEANIGSKLTVIADGEDENEAMEAIIKLIASGFGEE